MKGQLMAITTVIDDEKAIAAAKKNLEKAIMESLKGMIKTRMQLLDCGLVQISCVVEDNLPEQMQIQEEEEGENPSYI